MSELTFIKSIFIKDRYSIFDGDKNIGNIIKKQSTGEFVVTLYTKPCHTECQFCSLSEAKEKAMYIWQANVLKINHGNKNVNTRQVVNERYTVKIPKSMVLYCFAAVNVYDFDRRVYILSKYIKRKVDMQYNRDVILAFTNIFRG